MWQNRAFIFFFVIFLRSIESRQPDPFFRRDYLYLEDFNAFYKTHWNTDGHLNWTSAFLTCQNEESILFYPKTQEESKVIMSVVRGENPNVSFVLLGLRDGFNAGELMTADGTSTPYPILQDGTKPSTNDCVFMNTEQYILAPCTSEDNEPTAFVCKKVIDPSCPTIDRGYEFFEEHKKCYKVNTRPKSWHEAAATCFKEGGTLAVPDNEGKRKTIQDIITKKMNRYTNTAQEYFMGVYKMIHSPVPFTVKNHIFGTNPTDYREYISIPEDNYMEYEYCVSIIATDGNNYLILYKAQCNYPRPFVCEMDVTFE